MMRKILIIGISTLFALIIAVVIYCKLPFYLKYGREIKFGNELIANIEKFRTENDSIPNSNDWEVLKSFGFPVEMEQLPIYNKVNRTDYVVIYCWGFDPPWLFYRSDTKQWKYDFNGYE
jgi:hypothetical protein